MLVVVAILNGASRDDGATETTAKFHLEQTSRPDHRADAALPLTAGHLRSALTAFRDGPDLLAMHEPLQSSASVRAKFHSDGSSGLDGITRGIPAGLQARGRKHARPGPTIPSPFVGGLKGVAGRRLQCQ